MIYYFSGTGNSEYIARAAAKELNENTPCDITKDIMPLDSDSLGLVMPVYAWGIPAIVETFIKKQLPSLTKGKRIAYAWCILTHGDDMGYADHILRRRLAAVGVSLHAAFSLSMPNTYVCLPGFDVDDQTLADKKVCDSTEALHDICNAINRKEHCTRVTRGAMPLTKTYVIRPLFNRFLVTDKYFHVDASRCTHCGLCEKHCPLHNIASECDHISWHGNCTGCLRCYHACPCNAIQFGRFTRGKGQKDVRVTVAASLQRKPSHDTLQADEAEH